MILHKVFNLWFIFNEASPRMPLSPDPLLNNHKQNRWWAWNLFSISSRFSNLQWKLCVARDVHYPSTDKCPELQSVLWFNGFAPRCRKNAQFRYLIKGLDSTNMISSSELKWNYFNGPIFIPESSISSRISRSSRVGWANSIIVRFDLLWLHFQANLKHSMIHKQKAWMISYNGTRREEREAFWERLNERIPFSVF